MWKKTSAKNTIPEIVKERTGMSEAELMNDEREYVYPNLDKAAELLLSHVAKASKIKVYGDYDADGVTSLFILMELFKALGYENVEIIAPRRFTDGYGINPARVKEFYEDGTDLLITIDNGIAAIDAIKLAKSLGMDVLILDHHEAFVDENGQTVLPEADVIVDPHVTGGYVKGDESHRFEDLCGAGIGYRFAGEVLSRIGNITEDAKSDILDRMLCAAGIGTVADVVSLVDENRRIVKEATKKIVGGYGTEGLACLLNTLGVERITSENIAFTLAPCINAAGRLYDDGAQTMVTILSFREESDELSDLCKKAKETNEERKSMTADAVSRAEELLLESPDQSVIVLLDEDLSVGIAGLVAAKLTETYHRPAIALASAPFGVCKGSGRSIEEIDLKALLDKCQDKLLGYGGHPMAAGLSLKEENLEAFRKKACELTPLYAPPEDVYYDIECEPDGKLLMDLYNEIGKYEPYGESNPALKIMVPGIKLGDAMGNTHRVIGHNKDHVKLITKGFDIVWFGGAAEYAFLGKPKCVDVIGSLSLNVFNGNATLQLQVEHLRKHE